MPKIQVVQAKFRRLYLQVESELGVNGQPLI